MKNLGFSELQGISQYSRANHIQPSRGSKLAPRLRFIEELGILKERRETPVARRRP
jgi:hypothetical protein